MRWLAHLSALFLKKEKEKENSSEL